MDTNEDHSASNTGEKNFTALMEAAQYHQLETVKELIRTLGLSVNETNQDGDSALMLAVKNNLSWNVVPADTIKELLSHPGISVNAINPTKGYNALTLSVNLGDTDIVSALLTAPNIDVNFITPKGNTALILAAQNGHNAVVKALLSASGIQLNLTNKKGETALILARKLGYPDIVALLIKAGAKPLTLKIKRLSQKTALFIKNLYSQFKKHPAYYLFSGATRLAVGALVGYGMYYGLTALAAPYLVPSMGGALLSKAIAAVSTIGGAFASIKAANSLLTRFFGETKIIATIFPNLDVPQKDTLKVKTTKIKGILDLFGQHRPYVTSVNDVVEEFERQLKLKNKDKPDLLPHSKTFAFAYAKQLVESAAGAKYFDSTAQAEVNLEPYVSAAAKI
jgi:hypothetical protein